jgi:hypothetical protein
MVEPDATTRLLRKLASVPFIRSLLKQKQHRSPSSHSSALGRLVQLCRLGGEYWGGYMGLQGREPGVDKRMSQQFVPSGSGWWSG